MRTVDGMVFTSDVNWENLPISAQECHSSWFGEFILALLHRRMN